MNLCRSCKNPLEQENAVCPSCGYDPKTDTISQEFRTRSQGGSSKQSSGGGGGKVSPGTKKFATIGIIILALSILAKYGFFIPQIQTFIAKFAISNSKGEKGSAAKGKGKGKVESVKGEGKPEKIELVNLQSFEGASKNRDDNVFEVEGIFFDPNGKDFATINGKVVGEGGTIGKAKVKKINRDSVELEIADGVTKTLTLAPPGMPSPEKK